MHIVQADLACVAFREVDLGRARTLSKGGSVASSLTTPTQQTSNQPGSLDSAPPQAHGVYPKEEASTTGPTGEATKQLPGSSSQEASTAAPGGAGGKSPGCFTNPMFSPRSCRGSPVGSQPLGGQPFKTASCTELDRAGRQPVNPHSESCQQLRRLQDAVECASAGRQRCSERSRCDARRSAAGASAAVGGRQQLWSLQTATPDPVQACPLTCTGTFRCCPQPTCICHIQSEGKVNYYYRIYSSIIQYIQRNHEFL